MKEIHENWDSGEIMKNISTWCSGAEIKKKKKKNWGVLGLNISYILLYILIMILNLFHLSS